MTTRLSRIGNSRGVRIPKDVLEVYGLKEGDELELRQTREGILLRPQPSSAGKLPWEAAYSEMAGEVAERAEWEDWDDTAGDGIDDRAVYRLLG